jgi:DNA invertase Pin-like site-specific DNA recombinase
MKAFLGEMERRQVKYRTKKAMEFKKAQGSVVGSVPYGYRRLQDRLEPDEAEQAGHHFGKIAVRGILRLVSDMQTVD